MIQVHLGNPAQRFDLRESAIVIGIPLLIVAGCTAAMSVLGATTELSAAAVAALGILANTALVQNRQWEFETVRAANALEEAKLRAELKEQHTRQRQEREDASARLWRARALQRKLGKMRGRSKRLFSELENDDTPHVVMADFRMEVIALWEGAEECILGWPEALRDEVRNVLWLLESAGVEEENGSLSLRPADLADQVEERLDEVERMITTLFRDNTCLAEPRRPE